LEGREPAVGVLLGQEGKRIFHWSCKNKLRKEEKNTLSAIGSGSGGKMKDRGGREAKSPIMPSSGKMPSGRCRDGGGKP